RRVEVRNKGQTPLSLQQVASTCVDFPPGDYAVQHFHGSWARELNEECLSLPTGRFTIGSHRGTSSNAHTPYLALMDPDTTETAGRCYGVTLIYSGNHAFEVERGEFGRVRLLAGINGFDFDWTLQPGETFTAPEAIHGFSDEGLGGLSHVWHEFIRARVSPERFRKTARPTYLNTWEAAYFDVSEESVLALADEAADLGVEMLVLDDGWFQGRTDDRKALGDWTADLNRFPSGIPNLTDEVRQKGLKFGIWVEPEMVSPDSDLYRAHPDWAITVPGRTPSLGRHQLTLDLSRVEVVDHIHGWLDALLRSAPIDYVKWDMNRNMTDLGSGAKAHRYMLGLYDLLERLTVAHPNVLFEACASGGNRFDLGMLSFMPQGWISDMCDPVGRLSIINGASYLFPTDVMAAYIGPSPNHQNGRISALSARYLAGLPCAAHGLSLGRDDIAEYGPQLRRLMQQSQEAAIERLGARFDRLRHTPQETVWQQIAADGQTVRLIAFQILNAPNLPLRQVRLRGLDSVATYLAQNGQAYAGDQLMNHGVTLDPPTEDFAATLLILRKVS
ncbi:MAG: alpha-galactosidase, partial [Pseudomonadota bacterium]